MATAMAIADARQLWTEVDFLRAQVQELQRAASRSHSEQQRISDYVGSFVTHAQLDAALCTKISQAGASAQLDAMRTELLGALARKADSEQVMALQAKKLDISVYESSTWDLKKFRGALEQNVHDLFATLAHQMETQVRSKLAIEDFNRIFNPEANGQKEAIETAASQITRMRDQLESMQEYVQGDRQRQRKIADLNVNMLDLTRKHNASRNAVAQLSSTAEANQAQLCALETTQAQLTTLLQSMSETATQFQSETNAETSRLQAAQGALALEVNELQSSGRHQANALNELHQFTHSTILQRMNDAIMRVANELQQELAETSQAHQQSTQQLQQGLGKANSRLQTQMEQLALLESRFRKLDSCVRELQHELGNVRGPLLTMATNLREENVAILEEIRRSQNESREIMIDHRALLEREQHLRAPVPRRPSSSAASCSSSAVVAAYGTRGLKQHAMWAQQQNPRPQTTTSARIQKQPPNSASSTRKPHPIRAQTAGMAPKPSNNNAPQEVPKQFLSPRMRSLATECDSGLQSREDNDDPALFHFPTLVQDPEDGDDPHQ